MPFILVIVGLLVVFLTEYDVLGWILTSIGAALVIIPVLLTAFVIRTVNKSFNSDSFTRNYRSKRR